MAEATLTAVVTGASSGIGRALAVALARQGWRVGAVARRADALAELAAEVRAAGSVIETAVADVGDRAGLAAAIHGLEQKLGPTELLIANAGMGGHTGAVVMNVEQVERIMQVNFLGVVYSIEAVLPGMIARGRGHVVGISSIAADKGLPGVAAYCASKAAVNLYLEGLRIELRKRGVAVTAVCPGFVRTPMVAKNPPMPFLMEPDAAAARILRALPRKPKVYTFPRRLKWLMRLALWVPDRIIARRVKMKLE